MAWRLPHRAARPPETLKKRLTVYGIFGVQFRCLFFTHSQELNLHPYSSGNVTADDTQRNCDTNPKSRHAVRSSGDDYVYNQSRNGGKAVKKSFLKGGRKHAFNLTDSQFLPSKRAVAVLERDATPDCIFQAVAVLEYARRLALKDAA
jgi:hypothetical protein